MSKRLQCTVAFLIAAASPKLFGQWLDYPTAGVPRTPDGKPNLIAPAPRTTDGKPDLSGMWGWETRANCGARCNDTQVGREFINIASNLKGGLPYKPEARDLVKQRTGKQDQDPNVRCMPRDAPRIWTDDYYKRLIQTPERLIILTEVPAVYRSFGDEDQEEIRALSREDAEALLPAGARAPDGPPRVERARVATARSRRCNGLCTDRRRIERTAASSWRCQQQGTCHRATIGTGKNAGAGVGHPVPARRLRRGSRPALW